MEALIIEINCTLFELYRTNVWWVFDSARDKPSTINPPALVYYMELIFLFRARTEGRKIMRRIVLMATPRGGGALLRSQFALSPSEKKFAWGGCKFIFASSKSHPTLIK